MFNGLNYELFHYIKLDVQTKYDVGFYKNIELLCDEMIGEVNLENKVEEGTKVRRRVGRLDSTFLKKLKS